MIRLSQRTINRIQRLRAEGMSLINIAEEAGISYSSVYNHTIIKEKYGSHKNYRDYLAEKKGFSSNKEYREDLAHQKGYDSYNDLRKHQNRFATYKEYIEYLAKKRGFKDYKDYRNYLAEQRQKRPENKRFSELVRKRLKEKGKNLAWLANQIDVTSGAVSSYAKGTSIPSGERFGKVCTVLDLPYKTIDNIVKRQ